MSDLTVLAVASEVYPLAKTGGLADVVGALPAALAAEGIAVRTLVPGYPSVMAGIAAAEPVYGLPHFFGGSARLLSAKAGDLDLFVLEAPHLYAREGNPYTGPDGEPWADSALRFGALARLGASLGAGLLPGFAPDILQAHDWQAGLAPAYLHYDGGRRPASVMTVHNLAFQGQFSAALLPVLGLPYAAFTIDGVEYYGGIGFLKAGLQFADRITTVSPTYAAEICSDEAGMGLGGLLRARSAAVTGILNGIDTGVWDPGNDSFLAASFSSRRMAGRRRNQEELRSTFRLAPDGGGPLFGVVSRLTWQKGFDLLLAALPTLLSEGAQLAVLGSGEPGIEAGFRAATASHPGRVACHIGYDERRAHLMQGGTDALLVPSRAEPCGLTQLYAQHYGSIPLVARVGGLADTVIDANPMALATGAATGIQFAPDSVGMLESAIRRTCSLFRDQRAWRRLQTNGMALEVGWQGPARRYAALFRELVSRGST
jgi:starch synthase